MTAEWLYRSWQAVLPYLTTEKIKLAVNVIAVASDMIYSTSPLPNSTEAKVQTSPWDMRSLWAKRAYPKPPDHAERWMLRFGTHKHKRTAPLLTRKNSPQSQLPRAKCIFFCKPNKSWDIKPYTVGRNGFYVMYLSSRNVSMWVTCITRLVFWLGASARGQPGVIGRDSSVCTLIAADQIKPYWLKNLPKTVWSISLVFGWC